MKVKQLQEKLLISFEKKNFKHIEISFNPEQPHDNIGFFPYFSGALVQKDNYNEIPETDAILVLGQDFGTVRYYDRIKENKRGETSNPTLRNLKEILCEKYHDQIFLSNVFMGLRREKPQQGHNPHLLDFDYLRLCSEFLSEQIKIIKPKVIIALGKTSFQFVVNKYPALDLYPVIIKYDDYYGLLTNSKYEYEFEGRKSLFFSLPHTANRINNFKGEFPSFIKKMIRPGV